MYTNTKDLSSTQVCDATKITYRQLDYWLTNGVIPRDHVDLPDPGSGRHRNWSPQVVAPLTVLHHVTTAFPTPLDTTILADIYRNWGQGRLRLTADVAITWTVPT